MFTKIVKVRSWPGVKEDGLTDLTTDRSAVPGAGVAVEVGVAASEVAVGVGVEEGVAVADGIGTVGVTVGVTVIVDVGVGVTVGD